MLLVCKVCWDSLPLIGNEARLRGIKKGMVNVDNYADGVASVHLTVIVEKQKDMFINIRDIFEVCKSSQGNSMLKK